MSDINYVKEVCKIGQGNDCCRYLTCGPQGFECAKVGTLKDQIDNNVDQMNAKSDNCKGKFGPLENAKET